LVKTEGRHHTKLSDNNSSLNTRIVAILYQYRAERESKVQKRAFGELFNGRKKQLGILVVCAALVLWGCLYFDVRLAEFVTEKVGSGFLLSRLISGIPDILLLLVGGIAVFSWTLFLYLSLRSVRSRNLCLLEYLGCAVPLAYVLKEILKNLFGKTSTRSWLLDHKQFGFHWFHGGGDFSAFPSGHMAVFTVIMLGFSRRFPRLRPMCAGLLLCLATALIVTQYHFFSDIVAGFYLGLIVDLLVGRALSFMFRSNLEPCKPDPTMVHSKDSEV